MSVNTRILRLLANGQLITEWDMMRKTGATSAGRRLRELRADGWEILFVKEKAENGAHYYRHYMTKPEQQRAAKWLKGDK